MKFCVVHNVVYNGTTQETFVHKDQPMSDNTTKTLDVPDVPTPKSNIHFNALQGHNAVVSITGNLPTFGLIAWWGIKDDYYDPDQIAQLSITCPATFTQALNPNDLVSSFERETNLEGNRKIPTARLSIEASETQPFFTSRKIDSRERLLVRELLNKNGRTLSTITIGTIKLDGDQIVLTEKWDCADYSNDDCNILACEIDTVLNNIKDVVNLRSTKIEGSKLHQGFLS